MPPVPKSRMDIMKGWIEPYESEFTIIRDNELYCVKCNRVFKCTQKQHFIQHINTQEHVNNKEENFNDNLCEAFAAANIPLHKLQNPIFKAFLEKYMNRKIPDESTIRKQSVNKVYRNIVGEIKRSLTNKYIWISVDETTDDIGRRVVNVIVGALAVTGPTQPFLIATRFFDTVNADIIRTVVSESINNILECGTRKNAAAKVLLFVTDAAAYMIKAGQQLKLIFPNMLHITCLAHALHRICEFIRNEFSDVDFFISCMKKIFLKAHSRIAHYRDMCPELPLPPQPVVTRWGTWLQTVFFTQIIFIKFSKQFSH